MVSADERSATGITPGHQVERTAAELAGDRRARRDRSRPRPAARSRSPGGPRAGRPPYQLCDLNRWRAVPQQHVNSPAAQALPYCTGHAGLHGLPDQVVPESQPAAVLDHQPGRHRLSQCGQDWPGRGARDGGELFGREPAAQYGGQLQGVPGAGRQPGEVVVHGVEEPDRELGPGDSGGSRRRPPPAARRAAHGAARSAGTADPGPRQHRQQRGLRRTAEHVRGQAGHRRLVQGTRVIVTASASASRYGSADGRAPLPGPDREQPQDPVRRQVPGQRPSATSVAGSAHCTSSIEISIGARNAARSSDSCNSRSSQKRWSGEWLRSRSTAGSTGGSSAATRASSSGPNGMTCPATSPAPAKTVIPLRGPAPQPR